jgi:hypothetical protein
MPLFEPEVEVSRILRECLEQAVARAKQGQGSDDLKHALSKQTKEKQNEYVAYVQCSRTQYLLGTGR